MRIEIKELEGRNHFVVPMVMITEGVHNGSGGPIYYPAAELQKSVPIWNGKPIVVYHPDMRFTSGYAANPTIFNRQKIGTIFNTRLEKGRLKAEAWIDVERSRRVDSRVFDAIQNRKMMEVSTGLVFPLDQHPGIWNGKQYQLSARDLQPDHLAILPDLKGACSIADGAGLVRNETFEAPLLMPAWSY